MRVPDLAGLKGSAVAYSSVDDYSSFSDSSSAYSYGGYSSSKGSTTPITSTSLALPSSTSSSSATSSYSYGRTWGNPSWKAPPARPTGCAVGQAFYKCSNGFTGCCAVNPCNSGPSCPVDAAPSPTYATKTYTPGIASTTSKVKPRPKKTTTSRPRTSVTSTITRATTPKDSTYQQSTTSKKIKSSGKSTATHATTPKDSTHEQSTTSRKTKPRTSGRATSKKTKAITRITRSPLFIASDFQVSAAHSNRAFESGPTPPTCPGGNGTVYRDTSGIEYTVHCSIGNTVDSYDRIPVNIGGYGDCFSSCSVTSDCAGFTYIGSSSTGECYLKNSMPAGLFVHKDGFYTSCNKVHPTAAAPSKSSSTSETGSTATSHPTHTSTPSSGKKPPIAAIVGGVAGGVFLIAVVLLLFACLARRRREKQDRQQHRATAAAARNNNNYTSAQEPVEAEQLDPDGHQRSVSTSNDVFQSFGGRYHDEEMGDLPILNQTQRGAPPGVRAEQGAVTHPAYAKHDAHGKETSSRLDKAALIRQASKSSSEARSPRFQEHLADYDALYSPTSTYSYDGASVVAESPTLGRYPLVRGGPSIATDSPTLGRFPPPIRGASLTTDSPTLGHFAPKIRGGAADVESPTLGRYPQPMQRAALADNVRRQQHLASSNSYELGRYGSHPQYGPSKEAPATSNTSSSRRK